MEMAMIEDQKVVSTKAVPADVEFARLALTRVDFLGPIALDRLLGIEISPPDMPPLPDNKTVMRAHTLNHCLYLEVRGNGPQGLPLTMRRIHDRLENSVGNGKILRNTAWYNPKKDPEVFYDAPVTEKTRWRFASKEILPGSENKDYLEQTRILADYVKDVVYKDVTLPVQYAAAIDEFAQQEEELGNLLSRDYRAAAKKLVALGINQLFRPSAPQMMYYLSLHAAMNKWFPLFPTTDAWTNSLSSNGVPIRIGEFTSEGMSVLRTDANYPHSPLGVCFCCDAVPPEEQQREQVV